MQQLPLPFMTISYKWLSEYAQTGLSPVELAGIITAIGLEVEEISEYESIKGGLVNVLVGQVLTVEKIPDTEKLKITTVKVGEGEPLQIVCGAANVAPMQKVIVATNGAVLFPAGSSEPLKIKKSKIRGVESNGMICAEDEIGLSNDHGGIMVLPDDAPVGTPAAEYLGIYTDTVFEIGLTPNRSDAFSHIGVAREVAAYVNYHRPELNALYSAPAVTYLPAITPSEINNNGYKIVVSDTYLCPRYAGVLLRNIKIGPSPAWLQNRLKAIGMQPINNIVDITNYVLNETGQPLHAFDADTIEGKHINVCAAKPGEAFVLLDGREIKLHADDIVVCDAHKPLCLAGVYGGLHSGVTANTTSVFLESAAFNSTHIRRTSVRHNLRTDSALHFEKGTDGLQLLYALNRAAQLIIEYAGGVVEGEVTDYNNLIASPREITLTYNKIRDTVGADIQANDIERILQLVGFELIHLSNQELRVRVPSFKLDVEQEADVIEEIVRIYGFENIPVSTHVSFPPVTFKRTRDDWRVKISNHLASCGFNEIVNNSIVNSTRQQNAEGQAVNLLSYKNAGLDSLRTTMLPSVLDTLSYNHKRRVLNARVFEFGKIFKLINKQDADYKEEEQLCMALMGDINDENWLSKPAAAADWKYLKPVVEQCLQISGVQHTGVKQQNNILNYYLNDKVVATLSRATKTELEPADLKQPVWYAVINVEVAANAYLAYNPAYKEPTVFPSIRRDIALLIDKKITYADIENVINEHGGKYLHHINLFDVYSGDKIEEGKQSYAVSLKFNNPTQSLQDSEVNKWTDKVKAALGKQLGALIR